MNRIRICARAAHEMLHLAAIVLYDDDESGRRAKAFLEHVAADVGGGIQFSLALWRIDGLAHPDTSMGAFRDLERSTILALALGAGGEPPKSVLDWVECWAHCRSGDDSALVILGNASPVAVEELEKIAERRSIPLFNEPTILPRLAQPINTDGLENQILDDSRSGCYRHWGLNE